MSRLSWESETVIRYLILYVSPDKVVDMTIRKPRSWAIGRLIVIRYPLVGDRFAGILFTRVRYSPPSLEVMTWRSNYVFMIDSK